MTKLEFLALIDKHLEGEANQEEIDLLSRYYNSFQQRLNWNEAELGSFTETETHIFRRIRDEIKANKEEVIDSIQGENIEPVKVFELNTRTKLFTFKRIAVAASFIGLLVLATWMWSSENLKKDVAKTTINNNAKKNDLPPGGNLAVLTLADGSTIELDASQNGTLAQQGNTTVIKLDGKLRYDAAASASNNLYNTLTTPRGGQYQLVLPDGSLVWLNSASSIRFPTSFDGKERRVEITGEAYFEIASLSSPSKRDASKGKGKLPFIVDINTTGGNGGQVEVIGTHFNVNAYSDEGAVKTTLIEGSVKFMSVGFAQMLSPGQQSQLWQNGQLNVVSDLDTENVIAWKNGFFHFEGDDIGTVCRQISRWYNVEVALSNKVNERFYAAIPRNTNLSDVLRALELTGKVHFEIEGRKIKVVP